MAYTTPTDKRMFMYSVVITAIVTINLSLTILSMEGVILSKTAQLSLENREAIKHVLDRTANQYSGSFHSAAYNLTLASKQSSDETNILLKELLSNMTHTR